MAVVAASGASNRQPIAASNTGPARHHAGGANVMRAFVTCTAATRVGAIMPGVRARSRGVVSQVVQRSQIGPRIASIIRAYAPSVHSPKREVARVVAYLTRPCHDACDIHVPISSWVYKPWW